MRSRSLAPLSVTVGLCVGGGAMAQPAPHADEARSLEELGQTLTNPIAPVANIPFKLTWDNGIGDGDALKFELQLQPVVPFELTANWNVVTRFVLPFIALPPSDSGSPATFGMGGLQLSPFLAPVPSRSSHFLWGLGPIFGLPASTDEALGGGTWQIGPTGVVRYATGPWSATLYVYQLWSFADTSDMTTAKVSTMFVQPVLGYTRGRWTLTAESETTINWYASDGKVSVPLELLLSTLSPLGSSHLKVQAGAGWYAAAPSGGPDWRLTLSFTVVLPYSAK